MSINSIVNLLTENNINFKLNAAGEKVTTFKTQATIPLLVNPKNKEELLFILQCSKELSFSCKVLGSGSNLLIKKINKNTIVISLAKFNKWKIVNDHLVTAGAGVSLMKLSRKVAIKGLSGLEFASGIPASIGGAVKMNAGAHNSQISDILHTVQLIKNGELKEYNNLKFGYRTSSINDMDIVVQATLKLKKDEASIINTKRVNFLEYRKKTQPLQVPSAGSTFINPSPKNGDTQVYAAELIENLGLKGFKIGGAEVSTLHANWIINPKGEATSDDVEELILYIKSLVKEKTSYSLKPELVIWD